jgi:hypothetical protein
MTPPYWAFAAFVAVMLILILLFASGLITRGA